ncbi:MAG: epoxyqueuosine reductase [Lentisphaerae bacterium]|jgi:epoxyqueuosine reductase QueG|nr:epoxyqueuosine reductase [Lentisphaerota bacterium]
MNNDATMLTDAISGRLRDAGAVLVGFADLAPLADETRLGFPRAVSFAMPLTPSIVAEIGEGPTEAYAAEYNRLNALQTQIAKDTAAFIESQGWRAQARPATGDWSPTTIRAPFQHKTAATLAGLGWIGKCDLLVTPDYGAAIRWGTVLTDAPLMTGTPIVESRCGDCTVCVDICPGKACSGQNWRAGMPREEFWDPKACMAGMQKVSMARLGRSGVCGMCIAACPYTRAYLRKVGIK